MDIRRVVTAKTATGKSTTVMDGVSPRVAKMQYTPGFVMTTLWATPAGAGVTHDGADGVDGMTSLCPSPGETRFLMLTIPPDKVMTSPDFDPVKAGEEHLRAAPGIADRMEMDHPGMHTTPTIDYGVVLDGEIWLELDDGETVHLKRFDSFVQHGARHAWRNKGDAPATIASCWSVRQRTDNQV